MNFFLFHPMKDRNLKRKRSKTCKEKHLLLASQLLYDWGPRGIVWLDALTFFSSYFYLGILFFHACRLFFFSTRPHSSSPPTHPPRVAYGKEIVLPAWLVPKYRRLFYLTELYISSVNLLSFFLSFEVFFPLRGAHLLSSSFLLSTYLSTWNSICPRVESEEQGMMTLLPRMNVHKCYDPPGICCSLEIFIFFIQNNPREKN